MKILRKILPLKIEQYVYVFTRADLIPEIEMKLSDVKFLTSTYRHTKKNITIDELKIEDEVIYRMKTYDHVHFMRIIDQYQYPVIGDCHTVSKYRGYSVYPFMLQQGVKRILKKEEKVYILVSPYNQPSVKGIEKAGFKFFCKISTIRVGPFYFFTKRVDREDY